MEFERLHPKVANWRSRPLTSRGPVASDREKPAVTRLVVGTDAQRPTLPIDHHGVLEAICAVVMS